MLKKNDAFIARETWRKALVSRKYKQIYEAYGSYPLKYDAKIDFTMSNDRCMIGVALDIFKLDPNDVNCIPQLALITGFSEQQLEKFIRLNDDEKLSFRALAKQIMTTKPEME